MTNEIIIKDTTSNPAPLGLICFGMTTVLLNIHNAGFFPLDTMILAMGTFIGGLAQVVAGSLEGRKNNTFGTTAFTAYGFFWLSLVGLIVFPKLGFGEAPSKFSMGCYLTIWGIFSLGMFFGTLKGPKTLQFVFATLFTLFFLLALGDFTGSALITKIAGFEGIICGASAMYLSIGEVLNEKYGREIFPYTM